MGTQHGQRGDPKCQLRTSASSASLRLPAERPPSPAPASNSKSQISNQLALPPLRVLRGLLFKPSDSPRQANARTCKNLQCFLETRFRSHDLPMHQMQPFATSSCSRRAQGQQWTWTGATGWARARLGSCASRASCRKPAPRNEAEQRGTFWQRGAASSPAFSEVSAMIRKCLFQPPESVIGEAGLPSEIRTSVPSVFSVVKLRTPNLAFEAGVGEAGLRGPVPMQPDETHRSMQQIIPKPPHEPCSRIPQIATFRKRFRRTSRPMQHNPPECSIQQMISAPSPSSGPTLKSQIPNSQFQIPNPKSQIQPRPRGENSWERHGTFRLSPRRPHLMVRSAYSPTVPPPYSPAARNRRPAVSQQLQAE
jgi:hypothetical protein